jgi:endonuclease/exonuclease/phosphatase family metal-dependent hydrolase
MREFTFGAFNAHWGVGRFGALRKVRYDVSNVVRSFGCDIVVVSEAWRDVDGTSTVDGLRADGMHIESVELMDLAHRRVHDRSAVPREGKWELAICSRFPVLDRRTIPIGTLKSDPPGLRHALALHIDIDGTPVEVIGVHTSSKVWRLSPVRHLLKLQRGITPDGPQILAGDFNFWGPPVGMIFRGWQRPVRGRTYPSHGPHSQIDHILVRGGVEALDGEVLPTTPSDHRPIRARLRIPRAVS